MAPANPLQTKTAGSFADPAQSYREIDEILPARKAVKEKKGMTPDPNATASGGARQTKPTAKKSGTNGPQMPAWIE